MKTPKELAERYGLATERPKKAKRPTSPTLTRFLDPRRKVYPPPAPPVSWTVPYESPAEIAAKEEHARWLARMQEGIPLSQFTPKRTK